MGTRGGGGLARAREVLSWGLEVAVAGADLSGMLFNTATFRPSDWLFHEAIRTPPSLDAYITHSSFHLFSISSFHFYHSIP
jgi:hypothetical protein